LLHTSRAAADHYGEQPRRSPRDASPEVGQAIEAAQNAFLVQGRAADTSAGADPWHPRCQGSVSIT